MAANNDMVRTLANISQIKSLLKVLKYDHIGVVKYPKDGQQFSTTISMHSYIYNGHLRDKCDLMLLGRKLEK